MKALASANIQELQGTGLEYLLTQDGETVRLVFWDGNIVRPNASGNTEDTVVTTTNNA